MLHPLQEQSSLRIYDRNRANYWPGTSNTDWQNPGWQLRNCVSTPESLLQFFPELSLLEQQSVRQRFPLLITPHYLALMDLSKGTEDPLARQVVPSAKELIHTPGMNLDPFGEEHQYSPVYGLVKRYPDRVMIVTTNYCPSLCRYCTRKWNFEEGVGLNREKLDVIIEYLKQDTSVREVIISGGEPFMLNPELFEEILSRVFKVSHVEVVRVASRILTFLPFRVRQFASIMAKYKPIWMVTHFNHPNEIINETEEAIDQLVSAGVVLCNQTVLLQGVNNRIEVMKPLVRLLQRVRIKPYYIFQADPIDGTHHFRASLEDGLRIMSELRGHTGGICVPVFAVDLPGGGKIPLLPEYIVEQTKEQITFRNYEGHLFTYSVNDAQTKPKHLPQVRLPTLAD